MGGQFKIWPDFSRWPTVIITPDTGILINNSMLIKPVQLYSHFDLTSTPDIGIIWTTDTKICLSSLSRAAWL